MRAAGTRQRRRGTRRADWPNRCCVQVIVDGLFVYAHAADNGREPFDLGALWPISVAAVEIYRGPAETPIELDATGSDCGTIAIWTHDAPGRSHPRANARTRAESPSC